MKKFTLKKGLIALSILFLGSAYSYGSDLVGKWTLAPINDCLAVGATQGSAEWWGLKDGLTTRPCIMDDTIVFKADGSFQNIMGDETWIENWQGTEGCGAPVAPHDGSIEDATWKVNDDGAIVIKGKGAHIGLPKVFSTGELTVLPSLEETPDSIIYTTYEVTTEDEMTLLTIDINFKEGNWWRFVYVKVDDEEPNSIATVAGSKLSVYPNPANGTIFVNSNNTSIYDITGKLMLNATGSKVDISSLKSGLYVVKAGNQAQKLIVK